MPVTIVETPGAVNANSYESLNEFKAYLGLRLHVPASVSALLTSDPDEILPKSLIMATRGLDQIFTRFRKLNIVEGKNGIIKFYVTRPYWTGSVASATQALAWPRIGMFDRNGNAIASTVIPQELKNAESEMAILAITTDLTADNQVVAQGITSIKAGPVALTFKDFIQKQLIPDAVSLALVPSWITDELVEQIPQAQFSTLGSRSF